MRPIYLQEIQENWAQMAKAEILRGCIDRLRRTTKVRSKFGAKKINVKPSISSLSYKGTISSRRKSSYPNGTKSPKEMSFHLNHLQQWTKRPSIGEGNGAKMEPKIGFYQLG